MRTLPVVVVSLALSSVGAGADQPDEAASTRYVHQIVPSPDGRYLCLSASASRRRGLCIISARTGRLSYAWTPSTSDKPEPTVILGWSRDSAALLATGTRPPVFVEGRSLRLEDVYRDVYWLIEGGQGSQWAEKQVRLPSREDAPAGFTFMLGGPGRKLLGAARQLDATRELVWFSADTGAVTRRVATVPAYADVRSPGMWLGRVYFLADEACWPEEFLGKACAGEWQEAYQWAVQHVPRWRWRSVDLRTGHGAAYGEAMEGRTYACALSQDCLYGAIILLARPPGGTNSLVVTRLREGRAARSLEVPNGAWRLAWAPSSDRLLLYGVPGGAGGIWVAHPAEKRVERVLGKRHHPWHAAWSADSKNIYFAEEGIVWWLDPDSRAVRRLFDTSAL